MQLPLGAGRATATTLAGSLLASWLAQGLIATFMGKGLVPDEVTTQPAFLLAVSAGAALTVILATWIGLPVSATHALLGLVLVALVMAAGGIVNARRVAETMSRKITQMNPGQGFTANLVTSLLVAGASRLGLPVSTTHVAVGSLFGIGLVNGTAQARMILTILTAWVTTLPISAVLAAATYLLLRPLL